MKQPQKTNTLFDSKFFGLAILLGAALLVFTTSSVTRSQDTKLAATDIQNAYYDSYDYEKDGDYDEAIAALDPVYELYSDGYTVNLRLAWLNYLNKSYDESVDYYKAVIKTAPASLEAKIGCMLPLLAQQKYSDVEQLAYQVLSADDNNYLASLRLAYSLRMQGKYETAEKLVKEMLALFPTDVSFLTELALNKEAQEDYEAADSIFWSVLILDPNNTEAAAYFSYPVDEE